MSKSSEEMEARNAKAPRGRQDHTAETSAPNRRLDAFARLLATQSVCVATSMIDGRLHIAANELYTNSKSNITIKSIEKIAQYFYQVANQKKTQFSRNQIFAEICSLHRLSELNKGAFPIPKDFPPIIAQELLDHDKHTDSIYFHLSDFGNLSRAAGFAYGEFTLLYRDFVKLERTLSGKKDSRSPVTDVFEDSALEVQAIKAAFKQPAILLKEESQKGIHAEIQLLSYFLKKHQAEKQPRDQAAIPHYIGISKLCCLNCRVTFEAANEVFKQQKLPIQFAVRGQHDLDFAGWKLPDLFVAKKDAGLSSSSSSSSSQPPLMHQLANQIGQLALKNIEKLKQEPKPSGAAQGGSKSDSDNESIEDREINDARKKLANHREFLLFMQQQEPYGSLADALKKADLTEQIFQSEIFKGLYEDNLDIFPKSSLSKSFGSILKDINFEKKASETISETELLQILQNPYLVGEKIAIPFKNIQLPSPKNAQNLTSAAKAATSPRSFVPSSTSSSSSAAGKISSSSSTIGTLTRPTSEAPKSSLAQTTPPKEGQGTKRAASRSPSIKPKKHTAPQSSSSTTSSKSSVVSSVQQQKGQVSPKTKTTVSSPFTSAGKASSSSAAGPKTSTTPSSISSSTATLALKASSSPAARPKTNATPSSSTLNSHLLPQALNTTQSFRTLRSNAPKLKELTSKQSKPSSNIAGNLNEQASSATSKEESSSSPKKPDH